jgi:hypothetical protein
VNELQIPHFLALGLELCNYPGIVKIVEKYLSLFVLYSTIVCNGLSACLADILQSEVYAHELFLHIDRSVPATIWNGCSIFVNSKELLWE